ncbi:conserved hypothetical protein [Lausannevirus]|uniref:Uncharacterized protein n=1 Tax=Lausannevirus TaxID=999883 RepID=F2WLY1_9VIRU|nr:hypothetical protein LAU_0404 [Lausannevirus]AEA07254.1 conserved hypothetical protein [Lausannevirus]
MEEIRKVIPWPLLDISTVGCKTFMVLPGVVFSYKLKKDGTEQVLANFSGKQVSYRGKDHLGVFIQTLKKLVEMEQKRQTNSDVIERLLKNVKDLEEERNKYKKKYEMLKGAIEFVPEGEKYENAKKRFYENI